MKMIFATLALALAITTTGAVQASTVDNGGLPGWATKALEKFE
jgi:hypothetical protein